MVDPRDLARPHTCQQRGRPIFTEQAAMHELPVSPISALRLHLCCWHSHSQVHSTAGSTVNCTDCSPNDYKVRVGLVMVS